MNRNIAFKAARELGRTLATAILTLFVITMLFAIANGLGGGAAGGLLLVGS